MDTFEYNYKNLDLLNEICEKIKNGLINNLTLCNCNIDINEIIKITNAIKISKTFHTLDIRNNNIGNEGAKEIADAIKISNTFHTLNINWTEIGKEGAKEKANTIKISNTFQTLNIELNQQICWKIVL